MTHWSDIFSIPYLMGNSDKGNAMKAINNQRTSVQNTNNTLNNEFQNQYSNATGFDNDLANYVASGYKNFNPKITQSELNNLFDSGGVSGGIDPSHIGSAFDESSAGFRNFANNGGLTPQFNSAFEKNMGDIQGATNEFNDIYGNPVDPDTANKMMANGAFQKFIDTGGFSPEDLAAIRARAISPTASIYSDAQRQMGQNARLSNGFSPNIAASLAQMARNESQDISNADIAENSDIAQMVQQGKEFGATGMSNAATNLANTKLQGRVAGATGQAQSALSEADARTTVQQLDDAMKMQGLQGLSDNEKSQLQAELQNAQINEAASAANASINAAQRMALFDAETKTLPMLKLEGLSGATNLLGTTPAAQRDASSNLLNLFGESNAANQNLIQDQIEASRIPSRFQSIMGDIGSGLGLAGQIAGAFTGLSNIGNMLGGGGIPGTRTTNYLYNPAAG